MLEREHPHRVVGFGREEVGRWGGGFGLSIWMDGGAVNQGRVYKRRSMSGERKFNVWYLVFNTCSVSSL